MKLDFALFSLIFFVLISLVSCADRAVWIAGESGVHPDHPGKCWSASLDREFQVGEEITDKTNCELVKCGSGFRFNKRVCSNRLPQPGCSRKAADPMENYPDCCGMVECPPVKIDY